MTRIILPIKTFGFSLGIVHVEFIIIHPFREGNGRVARLLANLMALQARRSILNYACLSSIANFITIASKLVN